MSNLPEAGAGTSVPEGNLSTPSLNVQTVTAAAHTVGTAAQLAGVASPQLATAMAAADTAQSMSSLVSATQAPRTPSIVGDADPGSPGLTGPEVASAVQSLAGLASATGISAPALMTAAKVAQIAQSSAALGSLLERSTAATPAFDPALASTGGWSGAPVNAPATTAYAGDEAHWNAQDGDAAPELARQIPLHDLPAAFTPPVFEDNERLYRLYTLLPQDKRLFVHTLDGHEALSEPFEFDIGFVSTNAHIELKELMSKPIVVGIRQTDGSERFLSGYIKRFNFKRSDAGWAHYGGVLVPWTHFLTIGKDSRIFQRKTVRQVLEEVFAEYGVAADFEFRLLRSYESEDFIVQYQQSDADFVEHLMEREGWTYFFEHRPDGHKLVITDDTLMPAHCRPLPLYPSIEFNGGSRVTSHSSVDDFQALRELQPGKYTVDTYDYKNPRGYRLAEVPTVANQGETPQIEVFDGTPGYAFKNRSEGERYARLRMEEFEARAKHFRGRSDCPDLRPGGTTALTEHYWFNSQNPDANRLLITRVEHRGRNNIVDGEGAFYRNEFACQRQKVPYRPPLRHAKACIPGPQTATVTGPKGHEIWTNEHGCIKVRFHWDRRAAFDERSSCWIRVAQPWAGQGWGTVAIPRIGQEVIVAFLEGDPSRPVVLSSLYNSDMPLPYKLPDGAHMMGFKSNSTPGGGGFCEMVIHDQAGKELINIHSQKDMVTTVQNNQATVVNGPQQTTDVTKGFKQTTVKQHIKVQSLDSEIYVEAKTSITLKCGASMIHLNQDGTIVIDGKHVVIKGSDRVDINE